MPMTLFFIVSVEIFDQQRPRPHYSHIPFQDIEELGELVEAREPEDAAVAVEAHVIRQQLPVLIFFVAHRPELYELEYLLVFARSFLGEERVALHLVCPYEAQNDEQRAQNYDPGQ